MFNEEATRFGLCISWSKTKRIHVMGEGGDQPSIIGSDSVEFALSFVYSGSEVSNTGEFLTEQESWHQVSWETSRNCYGRVANLPTHQAAYLQRHGPLCAPRYDLSARHSLPAFIASSPASPSHAWGGCIGPIQCPMTSSPGGPASRPSSTPSLSAVFVGSVTFWWPPYQSSCSSTRKLATTSRRTT